VRTLREIDARVASIMQPISRETIIDRRQPVLRWSAIFGGTAIGVALWMLLEMLGAGLGLVAMNVDHAGMRNALWLGVGAMVAPIIAMFFAGLFSARFCGYYGRGIGALHGLVVWALTAIVGLCARIALLMSLLSGVSVEDGGGPTLQQGADALGRVLLFGGAVFGLGLIASVLGGVAGVRRRDAGVPRGGEYPVVTRTEVPVTTTPEIVTPPPPVQPVP
jgi:hypothetical protein